jgi:hypothetical protein
MGQSIKHRRAKRRAVQYWQGVVSGGGTSKRQLRELGRVAVEGAKIRFCRRERNQAPP